MKTLIEYFETEQIIKFLCKLRAKIARNRGEQHILNQVSKSIHYNYHLKEKHQPDFFLILNTQLTQLLPPRRSWVKLGKSSRYSYNSKALISSFDKNYLSLLKTIKRDRIERPDTPYLKNLDTFIHQIQEEVSLNKIKLEKPNIIPKPKSKPSKNDLNQCRPISMYNLKDRIVLSLTNKFFTDLFDPYFSESSFAFRSKIHNENKQAISHHNCVEKILEYKNKSKAKKLWVVECDIKKFFDTVDHQTLITAYSKLIEKAKLDYVGIDLKSADNILRQYLMTYSFSHNVQILDEEHDFWNQYAWRGEFEWVKNDLIKQGTYNSSRKIGVPQGGALSGIISNILLNEVDIAMSKLDIFYIRYCDDMIIISPFFKRTVQAKMSYQEELQKRRLLTHSFNDEFVWTKPSTTLNPQNKIKAFYESKSKGPYKWSNTTDSLNWISFVGYEINYNCILRVRKKSLEKEIRKQNELLSRFKRAISKDRRATNYGVFQTFALKLIGMSVGKVTIRNFNYTKSEMCWKAGFRLLKSAKEVNLQMKRLDRNRNKVISEFSKFLRKQKNVYSKTKKGSRQIIKYNKPFSYYYQVIERKRNMK